MKIPVWARLAVLFVAVLWFSAQVIAYIVSGQAGDPILAPLSVAVLGGAGGFVIAGIAEKNGNGKQP